MANDDLFKMLTSLPPTIKQKKLLDQMNQHFGENYDYPETRDEAQDLLQELFQRRERERRASA